jgi:hypothetical protein
MKRLEERDNMAMYITYHRKEDDRKVVRQWYINEPVPKVEGYVVTFQADGDELNFLLAAMEHLNFDKATGKLSVATDVLMHDGSVISMNEWSKLR